MILKIFLKYNFKLLQNNNDLKKNIFYYSEYSEVKRTFSF